MLGRRHLFLIASLAAWGCRAKDTDGNGDGDVDIYDAGPGGGDGGGSDDSGDGGGTSLGLPACPDDGFAHDPDWVNETTTGNLELVVSYSGGCEEHFFELCWPDATFMESDPVGARLQLWHSGAPDPCEAWIEEELTLDVTPMADAWHAAYGAGSGEMVLYIGDFATWYRF